MNELLDIKELEGLSEQEKNEVLKILKEYSAQGKSESYNELLYEDYAEIPVDIETFLTNDKYLGRAWKDANGKLKLYPFWLETIKKIFPDNIRTDYNTLLESGARGLGKAQPLDSLVLAENGYKKMGDLSFQDKVYGNDGKLHNIIGIFPQGIKPICKVSFNDGTFTLCCDEHLWKVYNHDTKKWEIIETKKLITNHMKNNAFKYEIPITKPIQFEGEDIFDDPYNLGFLVGKTELKTQKTKNKLNVGNKYENIPQNYLYGSVDDRINLIQGLMDSSGYINKTGSKIKYKTTREKLKDDLVWLIQSLGGTCKIKAKITKHKNEKYKIINDQKKCYIIEINLPPSIIPFKSIKKRNKINQKIQNPSRYIESIEYVGEKECQCIVLDSKEHLYLTNDFIVTHNSEVACGAVAPYLMYRVMCLKNPLQHYGIKLTEKIVFAFMNIKLDLSKEIAMSKFQKTIQMSPWFMSKGSMTQKDNQPYWTPPDPISIIIGSQSDDVIGKPIFFCLDGDTIINTINGNYKIKELVGKKIKVRNIDNNGNIITSDECTVAITSKSKEEYEIKLEDGTIIKCTPNHKLMLKDKTYKEAQYLTKDDELFNINIHKKNLKNIKIKVIRKNILKTEKQYYDVINANPYNNFLIKTKDKYIVSHNCFFDEISFIKNQDIDKQKEKAKNMVDTAVAGMMTRFVIQGKNPCLLAIASSKRSEQSFMEQYIKTLSESDPEKTYIVDKAVWEVKPKGTYSEKTFAVGVGGKFLESLVIPDNENTPEGLIKYINKGYKIKQVPIDFKSKFIDDVERSLCDYAGESTTSANKYLSPRAVEEIINTNYNNPFTRDVLEIGDAKEDVAQYKNFFNMDNVPKELIRKPLYVHLDMSQTGDLTGIAGVWIVGKKITTDGQPSKDLAFRVAFSVGIKAPKGHRVSFEKNRNFIRWLKEAGFNLKTVSSDTYQSFDLQEQLKAEGFNCKIISVDKVSQDLICHPYQYLRSVIYERRITMYKSNRVIEEMLDIERNMNTGKVDHTKNGHKDILDAITASTWEASQHADEYAFDYGESVELMLQGNKAMTTESNQQQLQVAFEEELMKMFNPIENQIQQQNKEQERETSKDNKIENKEQENNAKFKSEKQSEKPKEKSPYMDFGLGAAKVLPGSQYINNGIMFW